MPIEPEDLWETLMRYDREIVAPRFAEVRSEIAGVRSGMVTRDEFNSHMDAVYARFDRIDSEIAMLHLAVRRIDDRMDALERQMAVIEQRITDLAGKSEVDALRLKIDELEHEIAQVKQRLAEMESRHERAS